METPEKNRGNTWKNTKSEGLNVADQGGVVHCNWTNVGWKLFSNLRSRCLRTNDAGAHVQQSSQVITAVDTLEMPT